MTDVVSRFHVTQSGLVTGTPMIFAHGFGCDQHMWRFVAPAFESDFRVVLFDHIGCGRSDASTYDPVEYGDLSRYASDIITIVTELDAGPAVFVGHSVSAMMGVLACNARPDLFEALILVGPSPRYVDDDGYQGGFQQSDIDGLLESLESNYVGWSRSIATVIMSHPDRPGLSEELAESFCRVDPAIAHQFAKVTFLADNREDLTAVTAPTLVIQCSDDVIAPLAVGEYVHAAIEGSEMVVLETSGHCPHLTEPETTIDAMRRFFAGRVPAA